MTNPIHQTELPVPNNDVRRVAILVAKAGITGAAEGEVQALATLAARSGAAAGVDEVRIAFTEQGTPALREVLHELVSTAPDEILILPWMMPVEPGFNVWIKRVVQRWQIEAEATLPWPSGLVIRVGPAPSRCANADPLLTDLMTTTASAPSILSATSEHSSAVTTEGSVIPSQKYRVLVCQGGPCINTGASVIWGHLRNEQQRLNLRTEGDGMMSARASCLGPCGLAPVVQVFPEGIYYGGVTEAGIDRILKEHIVQGSVVSDFAYAASEGKQRLRPPLASGAPV